MTSAPSPAAARLAALALLAILPATALAQAPLLQVSPVRIELMPAQATATLTVTNLGSAATTVQLRPFLWRQSAGRDELDDTDDLAVSPPITEIGSGEAQIFRLVLRRPPAGAEASYRLLLDQLPAAAQSGSIRIALRVSVPVFAPAALEARPHVAWQWRYDGNAAILVGANQGSSHVRILDPRLGGPGMPAAALQQQNGPYILPGATQSWRLADASRLRPGMELHLTAKADAGPMVATVNAASQ